MKIRIVVTVISILLCTFVIFTSCTATTQTTTQPTCQSTTVTESFYETTETVTSSLTAFSEAEEVFADSGVQSEYTFRNACFYCVQTEELLFSYGESERIQPASLAKVLTASVALFYVKPETEFTVGSELNLVKPHSSLCLIKKGHRLTLSQLITGMLLPSGNDAAYTIAVNVARNVSDKKLTDTEAVNFFCELMNSFAKFIGMENSNFTSPDGWDDKKQYTTAHDLLILTRYALTSEEICSTVSLREKYTVFQSGENITWKSTNQLLIPSEKHYNKYAVGMKTGTTKTAGNCLIAVFKKNELTYIAIVCGSKTSNSRYEDANRLFITYEK